MLVVAVFFLHSGASQFENSPMPISPSWSSSSVKNSFFHCQRCPGNLMDCRPATNSDCDRSPFLLMSICRNARAYLPGPSWDF